MTKKSLPVFVLVVLLAVVGLTASSCDDQTEWEKRTKQALWANQKSWHDIQDVVAKLYHDGDITDAEWQQFRDLDQKYRATHNSAVMAYDEYERLKDKQKMEIVTQLISDCMSIISQVNELIQAWKPKTGGA